jgi:SulP family sulfate permease
MNRKNDQQPQLSPQEAAKKPGPGRIRRIFKGLTVKDVVAGLTLSIPSIPDAMASGVLAGVNPVYGLYSLMIGTPVAAIFTGSVFMNVVTTGAMSIAVAGGLAGYQGDELVNALVIVALVVGIVQVSAGLLRLGFLTRFVSNSVMTGFISALLVNILSQWQFTGMIVLTATNCPGPMML